MKELQLIATGGALPSRVVSNEDLSRLVDTNGDWIVSRTGIETRRFCWKEENATTLAVKAAKEAIERSKVSPNEIGCIVCATLSGQYGTPSLACLVQMELELPENIPVLDVSAACTGFMYGIAVAQGLLAVHGGKYALVVGCEQLSKLLDMTDRSTCILFGDGAGAGIFELTDDSDYAVTLGAKGSMSLESPGYKDGVPYITMDGPAVFRFATSVVPKCITSLLEQTSLSISDVDWFVCHQANERIIDHCIRKLKAPEEKFFKNLARTGNTSAASIPLALNEMWEEKKLTHGQRVFCVGFGGGLTWAGISLRYMGE